jgi:cell division protein FtsB
MARKRMSKRARDLIQSLIFFSSTFGIISCLIFYLWVYTEIDETLLAIEIQNSTAKELQNEVNELQSKIESLSRPDVIARKAREELNMVFTQPETLQIVIQTTDYHTGWIHHPIMGRALCTVISSTSSQWRTISNGGRQSISEKTNPPSKPW